MADKSPLAEVYDRPGFKIRRCHQIAVSIFYEECREFDLTTTQYGSLVILKTYPGIDQITVARLLGLDRSTTATVLTGLESKGLIERTLSPSDRRKRVIQLTPKAYDVLAQSADALSRAQERLLSPLDPEERTVFLAALDKIQQAFNDSARAPLEPESRVFQEPAPSPEAKVHDHDLQPTRTA